MDRDTRPAPPEEGPVSDRTATFGPSRSFPGMARPLRLVLLTALLLAAMSADAVASPVMNAPSAGRIGSALTVKASGGLTPKLYYRATFTESAADRRPGRQCSRNIDQGYRTGTSTARVYIFKGRVPTTLACSQGSKRFLIRTRPGHRYVIVIGHKTGKASWDASAVTLRRAFTITR